MHTPLWTLQNKLCLPSHLQWAKEKRRLTLNFNFTILWRMNRLQENFTKTKQKAVDYLQKLKSLKYSTHLYLYIHWFSAGWRDGNKTQNPYYKKLIKKQTKPFKLTVNKTRLEIKNFVLKCSLISYSASEFPEEQSTKLAEHNQGKCSSFPLLHAPSPRHQAHNLHTEIIMPAVTLDPIFYIEPR